MTAHILKSALEQKLPDGWIYLPRNKNLSSDVPCLFLSGESIEAELDDMGIPHVANEQGFPFEGLDSATIEDTAKWVQRLTSSPTDAELLQSFIYYFNFDAFLPALDAPPSPEPAEALRLVDRQFYESLGPERNDMPCRKEGCGRGAVPHSVFCRPHHFESLKQKPCPFSD